MNKILLSWYAFNNDFIKDKGITVDPDGPSASFHQYFYEKEDYEKHILLTSQKDMMDDMRLQHLRSYLIKNFPRHSLEMMALGITDIINLEQIMTKIDPVMESLSDNQIDIFISPGTPAMQTAWVLTHLTKKLNTRLLQTRAARDSKTKTPELIEVQIERDTLTSSANIKYLLQDKVSKSDRYCYTPSIKRVYDQAEKVSGTDDVTILILGPSGSGKEHLAKFIHQQSARRDQPYHTVNCSAFTDELLRSELFGHKKGSFTGAESDKIGILQAAEGGTVFLDEIGDISPFMQQALLRVLQEKEIHPIGAPQSQKIDVRFIAATNADLVKKCTNGLFRWDLFYRLSVVDLEIPSLFERGKEELSEYIDFFIEEKAKKFRSPLLKLSKDLKRRLLSYSYPGNIRELENTIERLYVFSEDSQAKISDLPARILHPPVEDSLSWKDVEKSHIQKVLRKNNYNQNRTCDDIGYGSINTLRKKIDEYGIEVVKG